MERFHDGDILMSKNTACSTLNVPYTFMCLCTSFTVTMLLTSCVRTWLSGSAACTQVLCINVSLSQCFSHPLSSSCMCVILCLCSIPPVFHAHLLIRISTGRENPHSLDGSGGHRLQEVHLGQRCVELRDCHVGGDVIRREAILGDVQSRCK